MHKQTHFFLSIVSLVGLNALAQETITDTIKPQQQQLEEVVVTGQFEPQSIKKSVFNVRVINRSDIDRQAGNTLADVLNQYLNITVTPNSAEGRSTASMFGLDSNYLKVLIDNVPVVSDTGLGSNVDLTQINLDDIEQIEIIEGSMGVTHGANAVSGIINIITKKNSSNKWELSATVQEESIGNEYEPFGKKGRHIQGFRAAHNINNNWFASVGVNRNDFQGFIDERGGKDFTASPTDVNRQRGYSWIPKEQLFTNALLRYQKGDFRMFYKFDFLDEALDYYNPAVGSESINGSIYRVSNDRRYGTNKFYHHLNAVGKLAGLNYNVSVSQQRQTRDIEEFKYYIQTGQETNRKKETYQQTDVLYSTGTLSNFFDKKKIDLQVGYEAVNTNGYTSALTGNFSNDNLTNLKKRVENYDLFTSAEISVTDRFSVRPGVRYSFQSKFEDQWAASLGVRQLYANGYEARASYGRSYRTPTYDELYTFLVDANHNVQGNPDLIPESSHSFEGSGKKVTYFQSGLQLTNTASLSYMLVDDRIEQVIVGTDPQLQLKFININKYKQWNFATTHQLTYKNLMAKVGLAVVGVSRDLSYGTAKADDKFLYTVQINTNLAYTVPNWETTFSIFYKYNGVSQLFVLDGSITNPTYNLQKINAFSLMDTSARKSFFKGKFDATVGIRNVFDVVSVRSNIASNAGAHTAGTTGLLMGYGRSYFAKLTYNLNF